MSSSRNFELPLTVNTPQAESPGTSTSAPSDARGDWLDKEETLMKATLLENVRKGRQFPPGDLETRTPPTKQ